MKTITLLFLGLSLTLMGYAQVSKTVNVTSAGELLSAFTATELTTVTNLIVTGTLDARDFLTMRTKITKLSVLDISAVNIVAYTGTLGTAGTSNNEYPANVIPVRSFNYKSSLTSVILPSTITSIGGSAFTNCIKLAYITIPSSVTTIESDAFYSCSGLSTITIPSSVITIGEYAFGDCGLTSIIIPSSVKSIGGSAFARCYSLTSVNILASITTIESSTFEYCTRLTSVNIPSSVTSIKSYAFSQCTSLTLVNIPSSVTSIDIFSFYRSSAVLSVASNNPNYSSIDGVLFNKTHTSLFHYPTSKTGGYSIPSTVTSIEFGAFADCTGLTSVTIPSLVTNIAGSAFSKCTNLTSVDIPSSVIYIGSSAFEYCSSLSKLDIPASVTSIGLWAFVASCGLKTVDSNNPNYSSIDGILFNKTQTTLLHCPISKTGDYIIPSSVSSIKSHAFDGCCSLTTVTIPLSVSSIENSVFQDCNGLTSITIPSSVTSIESFVFFGCTGLKNLTIPPSVTEIGIYAFYKCSALTSLTIPSSVTTIEHSAFSDCSGLTSIYTNSLTPINLSYDVFYKVDKATCILYVPVGSKSAYQAANQWKDFLNIEEITDGLQTIAIPTIRLYPNPFTEGFWVSGIKGSSQISIIDLNGKILDRKQGLGNEYVSLKSLPKGVYIVKILINKGIMEKKMVKQ